MIEISSNDDRQIELTIVEDEISGNGGCNIYSGNATVLQDGSSVAIAVGDLARTLAACDTIASEDLYLDALTRVATGEIDGDRLTLAGDGIELRFYAQQLGT